MKIYIDVVIIENFIVNVFLLMITMKLTSHKYRARDICLAGFIGSLYTLAVIIPSLKIFTFIPFQILIAYLMIKIVCRQTKFISRLRILVIFFVSTFSLSGICLYVSLKKQIYILGQVYNIENYSFKYIILAMMILFIAFFRIYDYIKENNFVKNYMYDIEMNIDGKEIKFKGFLDTGNGMKEPVTNLPCILVEKKLLSEFNIEKYGRYNISFNTIAKSGIMEGFRIKDIKIKCGKELYKEIDAIVCPCDRRFSTNNEYNALLPRGIL